MSNICPEKGGFFERFGSTSLPKNPLQLGTPRPPAPAPVGTALCNQ